MKNPVASPKPNMVVPGTAAKVSAPTPSLGAHPVPPHPFGETIESSDGTIPGHVPHRQLTERAGKPKSLVRALRDPLVRHHASQEQLESSKKRRAALKALGLEKQAASLKRFPTNPDTRKGNLAEVFLAEYVAAVTTTSLPVYRLRHNPNVDQSMKGDDVLAFDLDSRPMRIVVGEAKFRATSTKAAVQDVIDGLLRSHQAVIPVSLQFVADKLSEAGDEKTSARVLECAHLIALGKLRPEYVGLLMSDIKAADRVNATSVAFPARLALISLGLSSPEKTVDACYDGLK